MPTDPYVFNVEAYQSCSRIDVINDLTAHGDRSALLSVETRDSQFIVTSDIATVTFLDEQGSIQLRTSYKYRSTV